MLSRTCADADDVHLRQLGVHGEVTTVLFVHGLESGPRGKKALALEEAGFRVVSAQMPCSQRAILRDPVVIALALAAIGALVFGGSRLGAFGVMITLISYALLWRFVQPLLARRMFSRSVGVQVELLAKNQIDVVLGSSFGGAVALELLVRGAWKGPTVLLCPAHAKMAARAWRATPTIPSGARVLVVHGKQDDVVPIAHSRALVGSALIEVEDDHRLSASATAENLRSWVLRIFPSP